MWAHVHRLITDAVALPEHARAARILSTVGATDTLSDMDEHKVVSGATVDADTVADDLLDEELLIEELSIDGMCGVY